MHPEAKYNKDLIPIPRLLSTEAQGMLVLAYRLLKPLKTRFRDSMNNTMLYPRRVDQRATIRTLVRIQ